MRQTDNSPNRNRFVFYYFVLVLAIGGLAFTPWVLASYGMFPPSLGTVFLVIGGLSPTIAAVALTVLEHGKAELRSLFGQFTRKGFSKLWFLAAIVIPLILCICALLLWFVFQPNAIDSYVLDLSTLLSLPLVLLVNFLMNMWEEIGWRGYALQKLQKNFSVILSTIMVGLVHAAWHWPQFLVKDSVMANNYHNFLWLLVWVLLISVAYSWVYNSTKGSLLVVSLFHGSINTVNSLLFFNLSISYSVFPFYLMVTAIVSFGLLLGFRSRFFSRAL